jgi:hypothetical protein
MSRRPMNMHIAALVATVLGTSADDLHIYYYTCISLLTGHYIRFYTSCHHLAFDLLCLLLY